MRLSLILTIATLAVSGCVVQNPGMAPPPAPLPPVATPNPDAAVRSSARVVINRQMAKNMPGIDIAPYTDCVVQNATTAELAGIADSASPSAPIAEIVKRPATSACLGRLMAAAKARAGSA